MSGPDQAAPEPDGPERHEPDLVQVSPPDHDLVIGLPRGWELGAPEEPLLVVAAEPDEGQGFRASVTVAADVVPETITLQTWQQEVEAALSDGLREYLLLDTEVDEHGGHPRYRRLASHVTEDGEALTMHQWGILDARHRRAVTVTVTVATHRFAATSPVIDGVVQGFDPGWDR